MSTTVSIDNNRSPKLAGKLLIAIIFCVILIPWNAVARDWYVRPAGGAYGLETGGSYQDAWDGLLNVKWGQGGVEPGDNLYICGLHVHDVVSRGRIATQADIHIVPGLDNSNRITIRGDYTNDPGIVWGAYRMNHEEWRDEGGGVWSISLPGRSYPDWFFQDVGTPSPESFVVLDKLASLAELRSHPGGHYSEDYLTGSRLYVHCTDGRSPKGRICANRYGYDFVFGNGSFITFRNLTFLSVYRFVHKDDRLSHVRWENCRFAYGEHALLGFWGKNLGVEVIGCELSWAENAIYTISNTNDATSYYKFNENLIHDIGVREVNRNSDAHAIGIQGGVGGEIKDNSILNCGTGPLLYTSKDQELKDTIVSGNFVRALHVYGGATGFGVSTMTHNDSRADKSGNKFSSNIVVGSPVAFRFQYLDEQEVTDNIAYNCTIGLESSRNFMGKGAKVKLRNNLFVGSKEYHIRWYSGAVDFTIDSNSNLFYPIGGRLFNLRGQDLTWGQWQKSGFRYPKSLFDTDSLVKSPQFSNESGNFKYKSDFSHSTWN